MRYLASLLVLMIAQIGAAWAVGSPNVARPGGSYSTVQTETPTACERLCADDTLCMAWSFHANSCELKATIPAAVPQEGVISGLSHRAPASMRTRLELPQTPPAPAIVADDAEAITAEAPPEDEVSLALLGGPDVEEGLRIRLGN